MDKIAGISKSLGLERRLISTSVGRVQTTRRCTSKLVRNRWGRCLIVQFFAQTLQSTEKPKCIIHVVYNDGPLIEPTRLDDFVRENNFLPN